MPPVTLSFACLVCACLFSCSGMEWNCIHRSRVLLCFACVQIQYAAPFSVTCHFLAGAELSGGQTGLRPLLVSNRYEGHLAPIDACQLLKLKIYNACHQLKGSRELNIDFRSHLELLHSVFQFPSANTYAISLVATGLQYSQAHTTYFGESMTVFCTIEIRTIMFVVLN